jgi:U2 small nuclear ribonucleoprotein A'
MVDNPVASSAQYRAYTLHRLPKLKFLDFRRVTASERETSSALFKTEAGRALEASIKEGADELPKVPTVYMLSPLPHMYRPTLPN